MFAVNTCRNVYAGHHCEAVMLILLMPIRISVERWSDADEPYRVAANRIFDITYPFLGSVIAQ